MEAGSFDPKRRLTGAIILVTVAVVVLPMLLRRPASRKLGQDVLTIQRVGAGVRVALARPPAADRRPRGVVTQAVGASAVAAAPAPAPTVQPGPAVPQPAPKPAIKPPADRWYVQAGAYVNAVDGLAFGRKLRAEGYPAHVKLARFQEGHGVVVVVGPYRHGAAEAVRRALIRRDRIHGLLIQEAGPRA